MLGVGGVAGKGRQPCAGRLCDEFVEIELIVARQACRNSRQGSDIDPQLYPDIALRLQTGIVPREPCRGCSQIADPRDAVGGCHPPAELEVRVHGIDHSRLRRDTHEVATYIDIGQRGGRAVAGSDVGPDLRALHAHSEVPGPSRRELNLLPHSAPKIADVATGIGLQVAAAAMAVGQIEEGARFLLYAIKKEAGIVFSRKAQQASFPGDVGIEIKARILVIPYRSEGLVNVFIVVTPQKAEPGLRVQLLFVSGADNRAIIVSPLVCLLGGDKSLAGHKGAPCAPWVRSKFRQCQAVGHLSVNVIIDELQRNRSLIIGGIGRHQVFGGGVEFAVSQEAVTPDVASKKGVLELIELIADLDVMVRITVTATLIPHLNASNVAPFPCAEIDYAPEGVVVIECR